MIMEEENPGEFPGRIEVGPIDSGSAIARVEDIGVKRWVE